LLILIRSILPVPLTVKLKVINSCVTLLREAETSGEKDSMTIPGVLPVSNCQRGKGARIIRVPDELNASTAASDIKISSSVANPPGVPFAQEVLWGRLDPFKGRSRNTWAKTVVYVKR
jgi:hypothetical protein